MHTIQETAEIGWEAYRERDSRVPRWAETGVATKEAYVRLAEAVSEWRKTFSHGGEELAKQVFFATCVEWNGTKDELWNATPDLYRAMLIAVLKRMLRATRP